LTIETGLRGTALTAFQPWFHSAKTLLKHFLLTEPKNLIFQGVKKNECWSKLFSSALVRIFIIGSIFKNRSHDETQHSVAQRGYWTLQ
jgi:hypothetical protein